MDTQRSATVPATDDDRSRLPIVVGVDGSASSIGALRRGAQVAEALQLPLKAVISWQDPVIYGDTMGASFVPEGLDLSLIAKQTLDAAEATAFGAEIPSNYSALVLQGAAAQVLIEESRSAEMLVVGTRGHGGFLGLLLGSVSEAVTAHASCPVLVSRDVAGAFGATQKRAATATSRTNRVAVAL